MTLVARDEAGNEGKSEPFELRLPERVFVKPLARALIEQRRILALDADARDLVLTALEALTVDPERFTPEAKARRTKFSYFPFGAGFRQCIGESFAWMEGVLVLATLAQRWKMTLVTGHQVEPEPLITLRSKYGMRMQVKARS
jgi:hypothetical protein